MGGNVIFVLGPKWRIHYYAHLDKMETRMFAFLNRNAIIGKVGNSGNAIGKPPHLHYAIFTLIPYPWLYDNGIQGFQKMFFLNPISYFKEK